jgi:hypothetical protein
LALLAETGTLVPKRSDWITFEDPSRYSSSRNANLR